MNSPRPTVTKQPLNRVGHDSQKWEAGLKDPASHSPFPLFSTDSPNDDSGAIERPQPETFKAFVVIILEFFHCRPLFRRLISSIYPV
jgi:hypothetical protein